MKYFAYGSNMLTRRLTDAVRAPSAFACGVAAFSGYTVRFHKVGADGSGKCTLIATGTVDAVAYGVLYELTDSDGANLDRVEGVLTGDYTRCCIQLRFLDGGTTGAITYVASDRYVDAACVPFDWYRDLVVAGAMEHGLPHPYIDELIRIPAVPDPDAARAAKRGGCWTVSRSSRETASSEQQGPRGVDWLRRFQSRNTCLALERDMAGESARGRACELDI